MLFMEYLRARGEGKEKGVPWFLHDKLKCYEFGRAIGVPTIDVLRKFDTPDDIEIDGLPDQFVLKPANQSSSIGVMVLTRTETGYYDAMKKRSSTAAEVVEKQRKIYDESTKVSKSIIVEEKVEDLAGNPIPLDYKAYCFQGEIAYILQLDRNGGKTSVAWFDGNFAPITDDRIKTNEKYLTLTEHVCPATWRGMVNLARRASTAAPTPFARIDMYASTRGPLLGEITLVPGGFYFGKYFVLSGQEDYIAGRMWDNARARLAM